MGEKRNACRTLVGKPEGKRPLGRHMNVENIKIDLINIGWDDMDRIDVAQDRDRWGSFEHGNEPSGSIKCGALEWLHNWQLLKKGSAP
jgi:hypothetical protein